MLGITFGVQGIRGKCRPVPRDNHSEENVKMMKKLAGVTPLAPDPIIGR